MIAALWKPLAQKGCRPQFLSCREASDSPSPCGNRLPVLLKRRRDSPQLPGATGYDVLQRALRPVVDRPSGKQGCFPSGSSSRRRLTSCCARASVEATRAGLRQSRTRGLRGHSTSDRVSAIVWVLAGFAVQGLSDIIWAYFRPRHQPGKHGLPVSCCSTSRRSPSAVSVRPSAPSKIRRLPHRRLFVEMSTSHHPSDKNSTSGNSSFLTMVLLVRPRDPRTQRTNRLGSGS